MTGVAVRELDRMLPHRVHALRRECAVDLTFGGPLDAGGGSVTIRHLDGNLGQTLRHVRVRRGSGLGGKALAQRRPVVVRDYLSTPHIVHAYDHAVAPERVGAVLALPVRLDGDVAGLVYLARRDSLPLGDRTAARAAAAVRSLERDLAIELEVRRRLAEGSSAALRDTRALGDVLSELEAAIELVADQSARQRLHQVCEGLLNFVTGSGRPREPGARGPLSKREVEVLEHVAAGASNNDIAAELGLMPNTVKAYLRSVMRKLGAENRTHAVWLARTSRLID
ncbi:LuxR family transcriptional regulator [Prauserella sp. PE36]|uniref:LuxR C-terminal-related transcriptional regulator n=1 Tax=Prauserella sp. PE36 TaxID=1504709 RepID=UPI000DE54462|nr:LuxR C-terminal-related transcriptional regulator [Prauserella sp. PE36]RBM14857.1 LuxR family transcriptional regulator [Prauserella sp. PE36]